MSIKNGITIEEFIESCNKFCEISERLSDGWKFYGNEVDKYKSYIKKCSFLQQVKSDINTLLRAEFVIFYNLSYGVPSFSFNVWNSSGVLLSLEEIRQMSLISINKDNFFSIITQQEHPVLLRPYFVIHPCHTEVLLRELKEVSKNIIVTFLGLVTPLLRLDLPFEYGL